MEGATGENGRHGRVIRGRVQGIRGCQRQYTAAIEGQRDVCRRGAAQTAGKSDGVRRRVDGGDLVARTGGGAHRDIGAAGHILADIEVRDHRGRHHDGVARVGEVGHSRGDRVEVQRGRNNTAGAVQAEAGQIDRADEGVHHAAAVDREVAGGADLAAADLLVEDAAVHDHVSEHHRADAGAGEIQRALVHHHAAREVVDQIGIVQRLGSRNGERLGHREVIRADDGGNRATRLNIGARDGHTDSQSGGAAHAHGAVRAKIGRDTAIRRRGGQADLNGGAVGDAYDGCTDRDRAVACDHHSHMELAGVRDIDCGAVHCGAGILGGDAQISADGSTRGRVGQRLGVVAGGDRIGNGEVVRADDGGNHAASRNVRAGERHADDQTAGAADTDGGCGAKIRRDTVRRACGRVAHRDGRAIDDAGNHRAARQVRIARNGHTDIKQAGVADRDGRAASVGVHILRDEAQLAAHLGGRRQIERSSTCLHQTGGTGDGGIDRCGVLGHPTEEVGGTAGQ